MVKKYLIDKRSPIPKNSNVSKVMSANRAKNTKPELQLRKILWANGLRGYRLHNKKLLGKPDIAFTKKKIAIFVHGCFWHRCPNCNLALPKTNTEFWENKFSKNIKRDAENTRSLEKLGWSVLVVWECRINMVFSKLLYLIKKD